MKSDEIYNSVLKAAALVSGKPVANLQPGTRLISDLKMESIDTVDFLFELEKSLNVSINLADIFQKQMQTPDRRDQFDLELREVVEYISKLDL
jgi:acyl carrier protein